MSYGFNMFDMLEQVKHYLNIDIEDVYDDDYLTLLINVADDLLHEITRNAYGKKPNLEKLFICAYVMELYENRGVTLESARNKNNILNSIYMSLAYQSQDLGGV